MSAEQMRAVAEIEAAGRRAAAATVGHDIDHRADAAERAMAEALEPVPIKSALYVAGDEDPTERRESVSVPGRIMLMDEDPRLKPMPKRPTLVDFFKLRFRPPQHMLQSAALARKKGCSETVVLACLLHDISVVGFIRADHGYWGAQLIEPYVDEEVSWAVRYHQALRFFPDEENGYAYPERYVEWFGSDYKPSAVIREAYEQARTHKWYMSARQVTINDFYSFDPNTNVEVEEFIDLIGRNFRQPEEGLGNDHSPSAHMWRTIIAPTRFL
jgi:hypothetical protein